MNTSEEIPQPVGPCILWTGAVQSSGYGSRAVGDGSGRTALAHRMAWEEANGPIPEGLTIDHLCFVRACVNPLHLEPVTQAENNRRARARLDALRRGPDGIVRCINDHPQTDENVRVQFRKDGGVKNVCIPCARAANRRAYHAAVARGENPNAAMVARRSAKRAAARAAKAA